MKAVYLMGFRGAGKTTLGARAASELGARFLDLDQVWEERRGETIVNWVQSHGLAAFREAECALLEEVDAKLRHDDEPTVVALGGGVVDWAPSRAALSASPVPKIFLEVAPGELWRRLESNPERLKIGGLSNEGALVALLLQREPHFEKLATYTLENRAEEECLTELKQLLRAMWQAPA